MRFSSYLSTALAAIGLVAFSAQAVNFTWVGTSRAWTDAANWTPGGGPPNDSGDTALIPDADTTSFDPLISTTLTVGTIHVDDDGYVEVGNSGVLTVTDITVDALALFDMTGTGSVTASGAITVNGGFAMSGSSSATASGTITINGGFATSGTSYLNATGTINLDAVFTMSGNSILDADVLHLFDDGEFTVGSTAAAEVQDSAGFTVDSGGFVDVAGTFELAGSGTHLLSGMGLVQLQPDSTFTVSATATVDYSGSPGFILGLHSSAAIEIPTGVIFTSKVVIEGALQMNGAGSATFNNSQVVSASGGDVIALGPSLNLADIEGAVWQTTGTGSTLRFSKAHAGNNALKGDVVVDDDGTLDIDASIAINVPTGGVAFFIYDGGTVDIAGGVTFSYEDYAGSCPNPDSTGPAPYSAGAGTYGPC